MQTIKLAENKNGGALIVSLVISAMLLLMLMSVGQVLKGGSERNKRNIEKIKAFYANEAGINLGLRYLSLITINMDMIKTIDILNSSPVNGYSPAITIVQTLGGGGVYSDSISSACVLAQSSISSISRVKTSIKNMHGWAFFSDESEISTWWKKHVNGNAHFNGYIKVNYQMDATEHVSGTLSSAGRLNPSYPYDRVNYPTGYKKGIIRYTYDYNGNPVPYDSYKTSPPSGWLETRFPRYKFTPQIDIQTVDPNSSQFSSAYALTASSSYTTDFLITLKKTKFDVKYKKSGYWYSWYTNLSIASYPIIKLNRKTHVCGTLNGRMTIVTRPNYDIELAGNILYKNTDLATSDDILALVSGKNIHVPYRSSSTGYYFSQNNTLVYAYLYAINGINTVDYCPNFSSMKNLTIYGGWMSKQVQGTYHEPHGYKYSNHGLTVIYNSDPRTHLAAPGIPAVKMVDSEKSTEYSTKYMNSFNDIQWTNQLQ